MNAVGDFKVRYCAISATTKTECFNIRQLYSILILLYKYNGDKYTGQWDGYEGQGEINYTDGTKYIGNWDDCGQISIDLMRHGLGTLYSAEGQVLNLGKWEQNKYKGKE